MGRSTFWGSGYRFMREFPSAYRGLYAVGRTAALFCGRGYPGSGISLADASYFGRRAGRALARARG